MSPDRAKQGISILIVEDDQIASDLTRRMITMQFPELIIYQAENGVVDPDQDLITKKLPALHFYQLAIPAPKPRPGTDFRQDAAKRGDVLFSGKAKCTECHVEPLWTEPGWNAHRPQEIGIDSYLSKPLDFLKLMAALQGCVEKIQAASPPRHQ